EAALAEMRQETPNIVVDVHGETTSEKIALGRFLDGRVSAVIGTHTHVQTADEQIFPGGTAFLCDAGMCGPVNSILGRAIEPILNRFISNLPAAFPVAGGEVRLRGWTNRDLWKRPCPRRKATPIQSRRLPLARLSFACVQQLAASTSNCSDATND